MGEAGVRLLGRRGPVRAKPGTGEGPGLTGTEGPGWPSGAAGRARSSVARPRSRGGVTQTRVLT